MGKQLGTIEIAGVIFDWRIEDQIIHLRAHDFVYQSLIGKEGVATILDLMNSNKVSRLLLNYEKGFMAEIFELDDRPALYKELHAPLEFRVAVYTRNKSGGIIYFNRVLEDSDYNMQWFTDLEKARNWLASK